EQRRGLVARELPYLGEVDDRPLHPAIPARLEEPPPLTHLVGLGGEVEDLPPLGGEGDRRLHDRSGPVLIAVAEGLVEDEGEADAGLLALDEGEANGEEELDAGPARELVESMAAAGLRVDRTEGGG